MVSISQGFAAAHAWLYASIVQPALFALGLSSILEDAFAATGWFMTGLIEIAVLVAVIGTLQRWRPVEAMNTPSERASIRVDVFYTMIHRLGFFKLALFFTVEPWFDVLFGTLRAAGYGTFHLDQLWPGVTDKALISLAIYLIAFDFLGYWIHRGQHQIEWWWRLHALHHSQRQMTMWSDNRNHVLDSLIIDVLLVTAAQLVGVAPEQFIVILALTQLSESLQHANVRLWFGNLGERLVVSPRFHRFHHGIENSLAPSTSGLRTGRQTSGTNFGILLPWWDILFKTANFEHRYPPTGMSDEINGTRDYGKGFCSQQWLGFKRLVGRA